MSITIIDYNSEEYYEMLKIRNDILRKPLQLSIYDEDLTLEKNDIFIIMTNKKKIEGCCILTLLYNKQMKLRQMAVIKKLQRRGIGQKIIQYAENIALKNNIIKIILDARKESIPFYQKNGYTIVGEEFKKLGIAHFLLEKNIIN